MGKHLRRHATTGTGYTNEDNPFGDAALTERFVWGKKIEKAIAEGADVKDLTAKAEDRRQAERLVRGWGRAAGRGRGGGAGGLGARCRWRRQFRVAGG